MSTAGISTTLFSAEPPKCVVVTGVSRIHGIGAAIADKLLETGYAVVGLDHVQLEHHQHKCHPLRQLGSLSERFMFLHNWISGDKETSEIAVERIVVFARGQLVGLINCAGIPVPYMPDVNDGIKARWEHFQKVIEVNLFGPFLLTELIVPHLKAGESSVVHISSTRAIQSEPNCEAYASSKAGILGLTHSQALSLGQRGVRVNAILPGWVETSGECKATEAEMKWNPVGRIGQPLDVAELCLFLIDGMRSGFITGQEFILDGGVTKKMIYPD